MYFEEIEIELELSNNDTPPYYYDSLAVLVSGYVTPHSEYGDPPEAVIESLSVFALTKDDEIEVKFNDLPEDHRDSIMEASFEALFQAKRDVELDAFDDIDSSEDL